MIIVLGIDPGGTAGFLLGGWQPGVRKAAFARAFQCDGSSAALLLDWICGSEETLGGDGIAAAGMEAFIPRPAAPGLRGTSPQAIRAQIADMRAVLGEHGIPCVIRRAADVKPWAGSGDGERLKRAGLLDLVSPSAMKHARSACEQCLYCAVHDCGMPDPLSRKAAI